MIVDHLARRVRASLAYRRSHLADRISSRSGFIARRLKWPISRHAPFRKTHLAVARSGAIGDVLMCTPALREAKRLNSSCKITFYTKYDSLVNGLPFIDEVKDYADCPFDAVHLRYEEIIPPHRHIAKIFGDKLGISVTDVFPSCVLNEEMSAIMKRSWQSYPRPFVVVNRRASTWTPNKDWPDDNWDELIDRILKFGSVIEIGSGSQGNISLSARNYINLLNRCSLEQLIAVVAAGDLQVGPISGPVHIAAAVGTPSVVIYGGYEHPVCSKYPGNIDHYSPLSCSPCWLREPCPYNKTCLSRISPISVELSVRQILRVDR